MKTYRAIADYYDAEYDDLAILRQDVPFLLSKMPRRPQSVLELAAGTGRAAIPLAQAGHRVTGVDYARAMLAIARRRRDAVGLGDRQLRLVHASVLDMNLRRRFDWICILFNTLFSFATLDQQDRLLRTVTRHLKPSGRFWLDVFHPDYGMLAQKSSRGIDAKLFHVPRYGRIVQRTIDIDRDMASQVARVTFRYTWFGSHGQKRRASRSFDMTFMTPRELRLLLERHGLRIRRLYGNYDGSPLTNDSPRMIADCCRA
jgi:ubiquinone/menaquinone biosynthesis C-methylase UbiE